MSMTIWAMMELPRNENTALNRALLCEVCVEIYIRYLYFLHTSKSNVDILLQWPSTKTAMLNSFHNSPETIKTCGVSCFYLLSILSFFYLMTSS